MAKRNRQSSSVVLQDVPHYTQGTFDGLCMYYCGSMMLEAHHPGRFYDFFGEIKPIQKQISSVDPLIKYKHYRRATKPDAEILANWFYRGEGGKELTSSLNTILNEEGLGTKFIRNETDGHGREKSFNEMSDHLSKWGVPILLAWSSENYGDHGALVIGYERFDNNKKTEEKFLYLNDPGSRTNSDNRISWDSLLASKSGKIDVIQVDPKSWRGRKFDKVVCDSSGWKREIWWPDRDKAGECTYQDIQSVF